MMKKTTNYDIFVFRDDNREKISNSYVDKLCRSIGTKNLLEFRPILVNSKMEIIDGQNRLLAAKKLGVEIYYEMKSDLQPSDMIILNNSKSWGIRDYLNYYCKNGYEQYQILDAFTKSNKLDLKVALTITGGLITEQLEAFKNGAYEFKGNESAEVLSICWATINYIKSRNGYSPYTVSSRFWRSLIKVIKHPDFHIEQWNKNLNKMVNRIGIRVSEKEYIQTFSEIYNWKTSAKVEF